MTLTIAHLDHMFVLTEEYQADVSTIAEKKEEDLLISVVKVNVHRFLRYYKVSCSTSNHVNAKKYYKFSFCTVPLLQYFQC